MIAQVPYEESGKLKENNSFVINQNTQAVGSINLPGSKSISNRVLLLAALSRGKVKIFNLLVSEDSKVMINALLKLGVRVIVKNEYTLVYGKNCKFKNKNLKINVMNSGITMRFLTATLSIIGGDYILDGIPRMRERPIKSLVESLNNIESWVTKPISFRSDVRLISFIFSPHEKPI